MSDTKMYTAMKVRQLTDLTDMTRIVNKLAKHFPTSTRVHSVVNFHHNRTSEKKVDPFPKQLYAWEDISDEQDFICAARMGMNSRSFWWTVFATNPSTVLHNLDCIDWKEHFYMVLDNEDLIPYLKEIVKPHGTLDLKTPCHVYAVTDTTSLNTDTARYPPDTFLAPLKDESAELVDKCWTYTGPNTIHLVRNLICHGFSMGLYANPDRQLVSWILQQSDGSLGMMHTLPQYRKRGYGYLLLGSAIKSLAQTGVTPYFEIKTDNTPSLEMVRKLGLKPNYQSFWIEYIPH